MTQFEANKATPTQDLNLRPLAQEAELIPLRYRQLTNETHKKHEFKYTEPPRGILVNTGRTKMGYIPKYAVFYALSNGVW